MKEKLVGALGTAGLVLWWILSFLFCAIPIWATGLPIWAQILIFAVLFFTDFIGGILSVAVYVYALIVTVAAPFSAFAIIFYLCFALWLILCFIPGILKLIGARR